MIPSKTQQGSRHVIFISNTSTLSVLGLSSALRLKSGQSTRAVWKLGDCSAQASVTDVGKLAQRLSDLQQAGWS